MAYNHFDYVPSTVERRRSTFKFDKPIVSSAYLGFLYPVCKPIKVMPGTTLSLDIAAEIRTGALVHPLADEMLCDFFAFNVPNRIVWEHWKQFIGAVDDITFNNLSQYTIPAICYGWTSTNNQMVSGAENFQWNQTIACHFELPYVNDGSGTAVGVLGANRPVISALPFRGYSFIWNEFFRPEQLVAPIVISRTDDGWSGQNMEADFTAIPMTYLGQNLYLPMSKTYAAPPIVQMGGAILPVYRAHRDLWTSCLPAPSLETLNLLAGLSAPVVGSDSFHLIGSDSYKFKSGTTAITSELLGTDSFGKLQSYYGAGTANLAIDQSNMVADFNQALLTVNNYRETIMLQNYYDVLNRAGSRYDSIISNIFGVKTGFAVIDIPELICHKRFTIYRNQVISMAETVNSNDATVNPVGSQSAYIDSVIKDSFFTKSFTEHGYCHILYAIRPARIRSAQGIESDWFELDKFDLYYPQFDGMGDVGRSKIEKFFDFTSNLSYLSRKSDILGYQEYGATWKYQRASAMGWLDPHTPNAINGFTLTENLKSPPSLVAPNYQAGYISCYSEFEALGSCLAISNPQVAPQFIVDIRLTGTITHPMPVYNIPGQGALL